MKGENKIMNKKLIVPALLIVAAGIWGATQTQAQTTGSSLSLVQKIAQKFNVKEADVQSVFDEEKKIRETEHTESTVKKLDALVVSKTITEAQKKLIIDKQAELRAKREANKARFKSLTMEQKKALIDKEKAELNTWAKSNNIDVKYLFTLMGKKGGFGEKGEKWKWQK
jgi:hypothetical protein